MVLKNRCLLFFSLYWKSTLVILTPIILLPIFMLNNYKLEFKCLYVVALMCVYWVTEALPLAITSFIPVVLFPSFGILTTEETSQMYMKETILIFFGGVVIALAIEYCNLHKRIALKVISLIGCSQRRLHLGLTVVTMFISMWIVNVAAAAMMCPVIKAVLEELEAQGLCKMYEEKKMVEDGQSKDVNVEVKEQEEGYNEDDDLQIPSKITICYYIGASYASAFGGCGTLIGTGANLTFKGIYEEKFPNSPGVDFGKWVLFNVPVMLLNTILSWVYLQWLYMGLFRPKSKDAKDSKLTLQGETVARSVIETKYKELGPMTSHEIGVLILFLILIALFFTRSPGIFMGWAEFLTDIKIQDGTAAIFIVILLFIIPANWSCFQFLKRKPSKLPTTVASGLITWKFINNKVPWGLLFLLGGGFALARGGTKSGMSGMIGDKLGGAVEKLPLLGILFIVCLVAEILTEFTANVAIANLLLPILAEMSVAIKVHPMYLMLPATLCCSMAFHMPVGAPSNAVVAGIANIKTKDMAIAGIGPSIITLLCIWALFPTWGSVIYSEINDGFPSWAAVNTTSS